MISETDIKEVVAQHPVDPRLALAILQDLQQTFNYIPREALPLAAAHLGIKAAQLYSMATFYKALSLVPKGRHIIKVCNGTACHLKGSLNLVDGVRRALGISPGETSPDGEFSVELVNCLGSCAIAPVMVVDEDFHGQMTLEKISSVLAQYREKEGR